MSDLSNEKRIKIRPIEPVKQHTDGHQSEAIYDGRTTRQHQLQAAREKLHQVEVQKQQMLAEARETIMRDQEEWNRAKASYIEQAREEGYDAGFAAGEQASMEQYKQLLDQANEIVRSATTDYHSILEQREDTIIDLAIHAAGKIIKQKITDHPATFLTIVKAAIKEIKDQSVVTIYLHPDYYEFVLQQKDELKNLLPVDTKLSLCLNGELKQEGCVIEHPFGKIDASVDTQLTQLRNVLHDLGDQENVP